MPAASSRRAAWRGRGRSRGGPEAGGRRHHGARVVAGRQPRLDRSREDLVDLARRDRGQPVADPQAVGVIVDGHDEERVVRAQRIGGRDLVGVGRDREIAGRIGEQDPELDAVIALEARQGGVDLGFVAREDARLIGDLALELRDRDRGDGCGQGDDEREHDPEGGHQPQQARGGGRDRVGHLPGAYQRSRWGVPAVGRWRASARDGHAPGMGDVVPGHELKSPADRTRSGGDRTDENVASDGANRAVRPPPPWGCR